MTLQRRGAAKHKHAARRAWLEAHPAQAVGVPGLHEDVTDAGRLRLDALCAEMQARGLFGTTVTTVKRETVRRLVSELRGESVGVGW